MILSSLKNCQLTPAALDWYASFVSEVDAGAFERVLAQMREDCVIQVNNELPTYGKAAIAGALQRYYGMFERVEHEILNLLGTDQSFAAELLCHYTPVSGPVVTAPTAVFYERDTQGRIASLRLYVSTTSLFEAFTGVAR